MSRFQVQPPAGLVSHVVAGGGAALAEGTYKWDSLLTKLQDVKPISLAPSRGGDIGRGSGLLLRGFGAATATGYAYEIWGVTREYADEDARRSDTPSSALLVQIASGTLTSAAGALAEGNVGAGLYPHASATLTAGTDFGELCAGIDIGLPHATTTGLICVPDMGMFDSFILESASGLSWLATTFG